MQCHTVHTTVCCKASHMYSVGSACRVPLASVERSMSDTTAYSRGQSQLFPRLMIKTRALSQQTGAAVRQDCLLMWQISQLDYCCGDVHIELSELVETINSMYGFICDHGQTAVKDATVDEAGGFMQCACSVSVMSYTSTHCHCTAIFCSMCCTMPLYHLMYYGSRCTCKLDTMTSFADCAIPTFG